MLILSSKWIQNPNKSSNSKPTYQLQRKEACFDRQVAWTFSLESLGEDEALDENFSSIGDEDGLYTKVLG